MSERTPPRWTKNAALLKSGMGGAVHSLRLGGFLLTVDYDACWSVDFGDEQLGGGQPYFGPGKSWPDDAYERAQAEAEAFLWAHCQKWMGPLEEAARLLQTLERKKSFPIQVEPGSKMGLTFNPRARKGVRRAK